MTTDFIQHRNSMKQSEHAGLHTAISNKEQLELTRNNGFLEGTQDIFDVLTEHSRDNTGLKNTIHNTVSLLEKARGTIQRAEEKILQQNKRIAALERINTTDELTGLSNRLGFEQVFKRELSRAKRNHENSGTLILIEIESHTNVESKHGTAAAESSLKLVSQILSEEIRNMDVAARLSDDEFVLLLPNTAADRILDRAQKMALRLNNLSMIWNNIEIRISASLGLQSYGPEDKFEAMFKSNDKDSAQA